MFVAAFLLLFITRVEISPPGNSVQHHFFPPEALLGAKKKKKENPLSDANRLTRELAAAAEPIPPLALLACVAARRRSPAVPTAPAVLRHTQTRTPCPKHPKQGNTSSSQHNEAKRRIRSIADRAQVKLRAQTHTPPFQCSGA
jgi:hypothetical protein